MRNIFWVAAGSAIGGMLRYAVVDAALTWFGFAFPWGTLFVNIAGSLVIGLVAAAAAPESRFIISTESRFFLMVGICGGFTTFSFLSWQIFLLAQLGRWTACFLYVAATLVLGLGAVWIGFRAGALLRRKKGGRNH